MFETLISKINTTLEKVDGIKDVFSYPKTKLTKFPCVFYKPAGLNNTFATNTENMAVYRFLILVMVATNQTTQQSAFSVLAKRVDEVIDQFDQDWNAGTIDGHRVVTRLESSEEWEISDEQDGLIAYAPLFLEVSLLTDN